jgi:DNA (cytosine-5)-methyltransferase 1
MCTPSKPRALEFFAGGGLARLGLSSYFDVVWANDIDAGKAASWTGNFGPQGFVLGDIHQISATDVPDADLAWASFPCQDLSLAGERAGLNAKRSGSFYGFIDIIKGLQALKRAPKVLVIENVLGLLTSRVGHDFVVLMRALSELGYQAGAVEIDARYFVPQSRPRVFIIACAGNVPQRLRLINPTNSPFITPAILKATRHLDNDSIWWNLPAPPVSTATLADMIDQTDQYWWPDAKTRALVDIFSITSLAKLRAIQASGKPEIGAIYRRTRTRKGIRRPYAEVRFDGLVGCLRTPSGGSSRQFLLFVKGQDVRARALNSREAMRLMGVGDDYQLPLSARGGLWISGDGVAVPVVKWLSDHILGPLTLG